MRDALVGGIIAIALVTGGLFALPVNLWFEVNSIRISDAAVGVSPLMFVDRTIHRPFEASWIVSVLKVESAGFSNVCRATGHSDYTSEERLPPNLNLDGWTWPTTCKLDEGQYIVRTFWRLKVFGVLEKDIRVTSNIFNITLKE